MELDAHRRDAKFDTAPAPETLAGLQFRERIGLNDAHPAIDHRCLRIAQQRPRLGVVLLVVPAVDGRFHGWELDDCAERDGVSFERLLDRREDARFAAVLRLRVGQR